jgi:branched-subunit amino acid aminotransferase/4-amino-4-deoxychorismate lyase
MLYSHSMTVMSTTRAPLELERLPQFDLLESLLWEEGRGFYLLAQHLERLRDSAACLGFDFPAPRLDAVLEEFAAVPRRGRHKVRIVLSRDGKLVVESAPATSVGGGKVALARQATPRDAPLLRHKTTYRKPYSEPLQDQQAHDSAVIDVILWDEAGNVTESGMANLVVRSGGSLYTPSSQQDLLPGVFRRTLLEQGIVRERQIAVAELHEADALFMANSVRGWMPLERAGESLWIIRGDFCYEMPPYLSDAE